MSATDYAAFEAEFKTKQAVSKPRRLRVVRADQVALTRVRYLWEGRIPLAAVTLMPGEEGIGKTMVGIRVTADLTRGTLPGEFYGTPRDVIVLSLEDGLSDVYVPRLQEAGADLSRVHVIRVAYVEGEHGDGDEEPVIIPRDLDLIGDLVREVDAVLVWVDSLVTTLPDEMKSVSYKDTAKVLRALGQWAEELSVAVAAPWHLNKAAGSDTAVRIMDSRAFRTAVRSMLLVIRDPEAPEGISQGIVVLDKANAGTLDVAGLVYRIRSASYIVEEPDESTGEIREITATCGVADWVGELPASVAREAARCALEPKLAKDDDPGVWLKEFLSEHGQPMRQDVLSAAKLAGISESSIKRASRKLRVHSTEMKGQNPDGTPFRTARWELPEHLLPSSGVMAHDTPPTDPTDPTREGKRDPTEPISASQFQSGQ